MVIIASMWVECKHPMSMLDSIWQALNVWGSKIFWVNIYIWLLLLKPYSVLTQDLWVQFVNSNNSEAFDCYSSMIEWGNARSEFPVVWSGKTSANNKSCKSRLSGLWKDPDGNLFHSWSFFPSTDVWRT